MPYIGNIVQDFSVNTAMLNTDSVTSIKIDDGTIVNADINASAAIAGTKISPDFGSQVITTTGNASVGETLTITGNDPNITFVDSNNNPDYKIFANAGTLNFFDSTSNQSRLLINTDGHIDLIGNVDALNGIDVTGDLTITSAVPTISLTDSGDNPDYSIQNNSGQLRIRDTTNNTNRIEIASNGTVTIPQNLNAESGLDVTGDITTTSGNLTVDGTGSVEDVFKISDVGGGQRLLMGNRDSAGVDCPRIFNVGNAALTIGIGDSWSGDGGTLTNQFNIAKNGTITSYGNHDFGAGIDVTGDITATGNLLHGVSTSENTTGNSGTKLITAGDLQIDGDQKALVFRSTASTAQKLSGIQWWNENGAGVECAIFGIREAVSNAPSALAFYTSANVDTASNNGEGDITERMRISSAGDAIFSRNLTLEGGSNHAYPIIELHSSAASVRKWRIYNGQAWNPDALLIYDVDGDNTAVTIEPNKLGINKGASSLTESFEVSGNAKITGNLILETSGAGIDFSAGADSASTSNLLDEYEEGEYTPAVSTGQTLNTSYDRLRYTKIGRQVTLTGQLVFAGYNSSNFSSTFTIGLPFNNGNGGDRSEYLFHAGIGYFNPSGTSSPSSGYQPIGFYAAANSSHVSLFAIDPNTDTTIGNWVGSGSDIWVNLTYFTD